MRQGFREPLERIVAAVARDVEPLLDNFVFVGGVATALLITDRAAATAPATDDVDVVVDVATRSEYERLNERLRELGLRHDTSEHAPICRWITPSAGVRLDVMPADADIIGFSNPWYGDVLETAREHRLEGGLSLRLTAPPAHLAAKWSAYRSRGADDPLASRDLEDIVMLVSGRPVIVEEVADARPKLRKWVARQTATFLDSDQADYVLRGHLPDARTVPGLVETVRRRLERIAGNGG